MGTSIHVWQAAILYQEGTDDKQTKQIPDTEVKQVSVRSGDH